LDSGRASAAADALQLDTRFDAPGLATAGRPAFLYPRYPCNPR
jgi:hypothetical protein